MQNITYILGSFPLGRAHPRDPWLETTLITYSKARSNPNLLDSWVQAESSIPPTGWYWAGETVFCPGRSYLAEGPCAGSCINSRVDEASDQAQMLLDLLHAPRMTVSSLNPQCWFLTSILFHYYNYDCDYDYCYFVALGIEPRTFALSCILSTFFII